MSNSLELLLLKPALEIGKKSGRLTQLSTRLLNPISHELYSNTWTARILIQLLDWPCIISCNSATVFAYQKSYDCIILTSAFLKHRTLLHVSVNNGGYGTVTYIVSYTG